MRLSDEALRGRVVIGADGQTIGEVVALFLDTATWTLDSLRVKLRRGVDDRLGVQHSMFRSATIDVPVHAVQSVGDAVVLAVSVTGLRDLSAQAEHAAVQ